MASNHGPEASFVLPQTMPHATQKSIEKNGPCLNLRI